MEYSQDPVYREQQDQVLNRKLEGVEQHGVDDHPVSDVRRAERQGQRDAAEKRRILQLMFVWKSAFVLVITSILRIQMGIGGPKKLTRIFLFLK